MKINKNQTRLHKSHENRCGGKSSCGGARQRGEGSVLDEAFRNDCDVTET